LPSITEKARHEEPYGAEHPTGPHPFRSAGHGCAPGCGQATGGSRTRAGRYASRKYWAPLGKDLKLIYTAADEAAAAAAFAAAWGERYPAIIRLWRAHWEQFIPFLAFPPEVRRVIYTTNLIESMNARLRKVTRNRGQFPSEQAVLKVLYLAVRNLEEYRSPNVGTHSSGWKQALQAFTIYFDGRIPTP
jgi:transposase-like protein